GSGVCSSDLIESAGSTSLVQVGNNFFMVPTGGNNGPELAYNGSPVTAGQFGSWVPIGAETTATGYEVAWRSGNTDNYTVWNTDTNGNYVSNAVQVVSGLQFQPLEPTFHQVLNGDGFIGI